MLNITSYTYGQMDMSNREYWDRPMVSLVRLESIGQGEENYLCFRFSYTPMKRIKKNEKKHESHSLCENCVLKNNHYDMNNPERFVQFLSLRYKYLGFIWVACISNEQKPTNWHNGSNEFLMICLHIHLHYKFWMVCFMCLCTCVCVRVCVDFLKNNFGTIQHNELTST